MLLLFSTVGDALKPVNDAVLKPVGNAANEVAKRAGDAANEAANVRAMRPMLYKASSVASLDANKRKPGEGIHYAIFVVPLFIGMAAAAGTAGVGMAAKGGLDQHTANQLNDNSEHAFDGQLITSKSFVGNVQIP